MSALLALGRGHRGLGRAASLWCGVKGMMVDGAGSPQSPPWHDVPAAVAPEGAIPLHQRGSDLVEGQAAGCGCSRSLLPLAAGWVLLSMPCSSYWALSPLSRSAASVAPDSHFQGLVSILLSGSRAGKIANRGVGVYDTVNKMFFEILDGNCVLLGIFA